MTSFAESVARNTYSVYSDEVIAGGADSQVYAVTIENADGEDLHYVYSPNVNSNDLLEKIRAGLSEPYKSLIPNFDEGTFNNGFLCFSRDQEKYESMKLNWADVGTVAATLIYKEGGVSVVSNDSAVPVTDISVTHADEKVVSVKQFSAEDFYTNPPVLGQLASGQNRVEAIIGIGHKTEEVEGTEYDDTFNVMHVTQISAYTATKGTDGTAPTKRDTYNVYSDEVIDGGADSRVYAVTIENVDGEDLHYVYSSGVASVIHSEDLMEKIREGLSEPYKSLIPTTFEGDDPFGTGLLCFSRDQEKYAAMNLDWSNPKAVANYLISGNGGVNVIANDDAISVADISELHSDENVVSVEKFFEVSDHYTSPPEFSQLASGKYRVETCTGYVPQRVEGTNYYDEFNIMHVTQICAYTATKGTDSTDPTKRNDYNVYAENVINGGADSQVYANTVTVKRGGYDGDEVLVLHYVYSPNAVHSNELMEKIRAGLAEPYKSLIPEFESESSGEIGFLCFSQDQEKYEDMDLDWTNHAFVAAALATFKVESLSTRNNDTAISVTDIFEIHAGENVVSKEQYASDDFYTNPPELGYLGRGENRVETRLAVSCRTEEIAGVEYYDTFNAMHVAQIYANTACAVTKIEPATASIDLPVRVLEDEESGYVSRPELTATFTPDSAVIVGEFGEYQGLAIDCYNPMIDPQLSEGYDMQAEYTVSIPFTGYEGETLSGTLTVPLPEGYDGATARIKDGTGASSYTAATVSFPVTLVMEFGTTASLDITIEYKEAQEPVQPPVIIAGANGSWQKGGTDGLSFTSNAAFADFIKVQVDGKEAAASNYTVKEGSTIVTLNAAYLNTLSVGKHTLEIESKNGIAKTEFTITAAQTGGDQTGENQTGGDTTPQDPDKNNGATTSPQTGNSSNMVLWIALLFLSGALLGITTFKKRKQTN